MRDHTLWARLMPQARELIIENLNHYPATTELIINTLKDSKYHIWTELPYCVVKMLHERIFETDDIFQPIEEEEVRMLFENYYEQ